MILSFKNQFKEPILNGKKKHTIREDKADRWREGKHIHFATGVRTKDYQCFKIGKCVSTQKIVIQYDNIPPMGLCVRITIDGAHLAINDLERLAKNDGFDSTSDFLDWFDTVYFKGKIIHWTNLRY